MNNAQFKAALIVASFPIVFIVLMLIVGMFLGNMSWFYENFSEEGVTGNAPLLIVTIIAGAAHGVTLFDSASEGYYQFWADLFNHIDDADRVHGPLP